MQTLIFDVKSQWKAICLPILLPAIFFLISVTKLWESIIPLCMCKGRTHHVTVLQFKSGGKTANTFNCYLQVTVMWQSKRYICDKIYSQNLSQWCHKCHRKSGQCSWRICLKHKRHSAFIHPSNWVTLRKDLVHMVAIIEIAYGMSLKSRRRRCLSKGEEVEL